MKTLLALTIILASHTSALTQRIGLNTDSPLRMLSVNGSFMVDQQNTNTGTLDTAALLFVSSGVGIFSNKNQSVVNPSGLDFWTGNQRSPTINSSGFVGINLGSASTMNGRIYPMSVASD